MKAGDRKRVGWWVGGVVMAVLALGLVLLFPAQPRGVPAVWLTDGNILSGVGMVLDMYVHEHDGKLPARLENLEGGYIDADHWDRSRFEDDSRVRMDWLYFPHERLEGLPPETILIASPKALKRPARGRWVLRAASFGKMAEAGAILVKAEGISEDDFNKEMATQAKREADEAARGGGQ